MGTALVTLAGKLAGRVGMDSADPQELIITFRQTVFRGDVNDTQSIALLIVTNQYGFNPWTKEIYAFPDKQNDIAPVVGIGGWFRIINEDQQFNGMDFKQDNESCTCRVYRKDRNHPICVTGWTGECRREPFKTHKGREITGLWQSHPKRTLRHKTMIQCTRLAFGFANIHDKGEAECIVESTTYTAERQPERDITSVNGGTMWEINTPLITLDKTWDDDLLPLCSQTFHRDVHASSELIRAEAVKALGFLRQKTTEQKVVARRRTLSCSVPGSTQELSNRGMMHDTDYGPASSPLQKFTTW